MLEVPKQADIVIGAVTADEFGIPDALIEKIETGMRTYFPHCSWVLALASSTPGTVPPETPRFGVHRVTDPAHGVPAKTTGYRAILRFARRLKTNACLLIDPAQEGFDPTWIDCLLRPGLHSDYDLVTPLYSGSGRDHVLSRSLLSPVLLALFGVAPKLPMAGEFLLSARLVHRLLARHDWDSSTARYTPELWTSFIAAAEGYRIAESCVGPSLRRSTGARLARHTVIEQVAGGLLSLMDQYERQWYSASGMIGLDRFGQTAYTGPEPSNQDGLHYLVSFAESFPALEEPWRAMFDPHTFAEIASFHVAVRDGELERPLPDAAWVRIVYETAAVWKHRRLARAQVLGLFTPLFLARAGSFLTKTSRKGQAEVEAHLTQLGCLFVALQPLLARMWTGEFAPGKPLRHAEAA